MTDFPPDSAALVTGAASGIGLATARQLLKDGLLNITLLDLPSSEILSLSTSLLAISPNAQILTLPTDVSVEAEIQGAIQKTVEKFGRIDFCVNAAGIVGEQKKNDGRRVEELDAVWGVNGRGAWMVERSVIAQMLKQELRDTCNGLPLKTRGSIVNIGSLGSHISIPLATPYVMSKHAILGLSKVDAVDFAKDGIRINCVAPGPIKTLLTKGLWEGPGVAIGDMYVQRAPMGRWGHPEEVAYGVTFLLSDKASFITGACIDVDGGYCAM